MTGIRADSVRDHNRRAWTQQVANGNPWTIPVTAAAVADAREGRWGIYLTPTRTVPMAWFPPLVGCDLLCLASGGGQQGPILAAAGATVTVYDNCPAQVQRDRDVAARDGLVLHTVEGDMRDLRDLESSSFDLIVHPVSNTFVPDVLPVWREAFRVLHPGGAMLAGFDNPAVHLFDETAYWEGRLEVTHALPHSDAESLSPDEIAERREHGIPLEFGHTLESQIGGQLAAGFVLVDLYEDRYAAADGDLLGRYMPTFIATRALKPTV